MKRFYYLKIKWDYKMNIQNWKYERKGEEGKSNEIK